MKSFIQAILYGLAKATLSKYKPIIVGITGSVGKTSAKEAVFAVLAKKYKVRANEKSFNTEIGLPLTILGAKHRYRNVFGWLYEITAALIRLVFRRDYPEILVMEYGVQSPGDMKYLTELAPPLIGVVTAIGEIPVHVEYFAGPLELAREKFGLIAALPQNGYAVLNYDDEVILEIKGKTKAHIMSFGFSEDAMVRVVNFEPHVAVENNQKILDGVSFKIDHSGSVVPVRLKNTFGKQQAYAASAAAAVGLALNMNLVDIARALEEYQAPAGRLKLIAGNKKTFLLDDTYNASPSSMHAALDVLRDFPEGRKIAVLGDMLELGKFTEEAHRAVGGKVAEIADIFIAVGERIKFAVDEIKAHKIGGRLDPAEVLWFARSEDAGGKLEELMKVGDIVLIKGSQGIRMERIVKEIMAEPQRADELLVRQSKEWLGKS